MFFKHDIETLPSSLITTFRIDFDQYSTDISNFKVLCTNVDKTTSDTVLINTLKNLAAGQSACKYGFKNNYYYDSIVRLDSTKQKLGIMLKYTESGKQFTGRVNLRTVERILETSESKPVEDERYTLVPFTIKLLDFRAKDKTSKILFYSFSRDLTIKSSQSLSKYILHTVLLKYLSFSIYSFIFSKRIKNSLSDKTYFCSIL